MKELEQLMKAWNLVTEGSVQCQLSQEHTMFDVLLTPEMAIVDITHPSAMEFIQPFVKKNLDSRMHTVDHIETRGSLILGLLGAFRAKTDELTTYMGMARGVADILAENKKTLVLRQNGRQLAKIGYGVDSFGLRLLNLDHIEVNDLSALMGLLEKLRSN